MEKLKRWCKRAGLTIVAERLEHNGLVFLDLERCPDKGPGHDDDGNPAILVFPDGGHCYKCFHAKCATKSFADLEKVFGPLVPTIRCGTDLPHGCRIIARMEDDPDLLQRGRLGEIVFDAKKPRSVYAIRLATVPGDYRRKPCGQVVSGSQV